MRRSAIGFVICAALASASAHAQPIDKDADAERLFREGQKLLEERRYGEACPKFEAAYRKDQQLGTLLNLAYCHKEQGALWQAWLEFREAELKAIEIKRPERKEFAAKRMAELEKSTSLARVVMESQQRVELTEILVEDRRVPEAEKGAPFVVEAGQRKFTIRAKGKKQVVQLVSIARSATPQKIPVPEMEDQPKEPPIAEAPPPPPPTPRVVATKPPPVGPPEKVRDGSTQKVVGLVVGGVGLVGVGIGSVFGLKTLNNPCTDGEPAEGQPPGSASCTPEERNDASSWGTIATVAFIGGGLALATGVVVYLTAPSGKASVRGASAPPQVTARVGAGWAGLRGEF